VGGQRHAPTAVLPGKNRHPIIIIIIIIIIINELMVFGCCVRVDRIVEDKYYNGIMDCPKQIVLCINLVIRIVTTKYEKAI
jgi:hypothetical protein